MKTVIFDPVKIVAMAEHNCVATKYSTICVFFVNFGIDIDKYLI